MRLIDESAIKNIAIGASFFGAGGGGNPYYGMLQAVAAVRQYGPVKLLDVSEIDPATWYSPVAGMGAPAVGLEKFARGDEYQRVFAAVSQYTGHHFAGTFPIEAGGGNSLVPLTLAATMNLPLVDADSMGRAFPELQMSTLALAGVTTTPMAITDVQGNTSIINTVTGKWAERLARAETVEMGGTATVSLYACTGAQLRDHGVTGIVTACELVGSRIRDAHRDPEAALTEILDITHGYELFTGKIIDVERRTEKGFNVGEIKIDGYDDYSGHKLSVMIQNENLIAIRDGQPITMTPDLIEILDAETLEPVTTEVIKYGKRVRVLGTPADAKWRTPAGIACVGPRYFHFDYDYVPLEQLIKEAK